MSYKSTCKFLLIAPLFALGQACFAGGGYVGTFRPWFYGGTLYIEEVSVQKSGVPVCVAASRTQLRLVEDPNSNAFKQEYAMLLAAWFSGRPLSITGSGSCTSEGDETISLIQPQ